MKHLTPADYRVQRWANGLGQTVEMLRIERDGALLARLSMAVVDADGPFSLFPGIERVLTVISGPGFSLRGGGIALECPPLVPVAFSGDVALQAVGTGGVASEDLNVMTARALPRPEVSVLEGGSLPAGGLLVLVALEPALVGPLALAPREMVVTTEGAEVTGRVLAARLFGLA